MLTHSVILTHALLWTLTAASTSARAPGNLSDGGSGNLATPESELHPSGGRISPPGTPEVLLRPAEAGHNKLNSLGTRHTSAIVSSSISRSEKTKTEPHSPYTSSSRDPALSELEHHNVHKIDDYVDSSVEISDDELLGNAESLLPDSEISFHQTRPDQDKEASRTPAVDSISSVRSSGKHKKRDVHQPLNNQIDSHFPKTEFDDSEDVNPILDWDGYFVDHKGQLLYLPNVSDPSRQKKKYDRISASGFTGFGKRSSSESDKNGLSEQLSLPVDKRKFDSISGFTGFGGFGKREEKRKFDSISGINSFGGFGKREEKRKFDSISGFNSFGGFGKREDKRKFDSISGFNSFGGFGKKEEEKRKFDSISGFNSFGGFGKREEEKRKFDSISGFKSFGGFGKREDKRKFDSISGFNSFGGFGKREEKRKFDSISGFNSFGGFGKREEEKRKFDSISGINSFGGFGKREEEKRKFDSISGFNSFGGFGKREEEKRKFDSISGFNSFGGFGKREEKRKFDSISGLSEFSGFGKREENGKFDSISSYTGFGRFEKRGGKRRFDSISGFSDFGRFGKREEDKRKFDSISSLTGFGQFGKRQEEKRRFDSISGYSGFGGFGKRDDEKRKFDSISGLTGFGGFGKRDEEKRKFDSISGLTGLGGFGKREQAKRKFDSISGLTGFGGFGKREDKRKFDSITGLTSFGGFGKREEEIQDSQRAVELGEQGASKSRSQTDSGEEDTEEDEPISASRSRRSAERAITLGLLREDSHRNALSKRSPYLDDSLDEDSDNFQKTHLSGSTIIDDLNSVLKQTGQEDNENEVFHNDILAYSKRKFDRIGSGGTFGMFGKRSLGIDDLNNESEWSVKENVPLLYVDKRRFDPIESGASGFNSFGKRRFDRISGPSVFGRFGKRKFDRIAGAFGGFGKRAFDRISGASAFSRYGKRNLIPVEYFLWDADTLGAWEDSNDVSAFKEPVVFNIESLPNPNLADEDVDSVVKRRFDSISHGSRFRMFGKRDNGPNTVSS